MKSLRKFFSIIMMGVMVISTASLGGCSFYTKKDLSEYTKERLREEYGEEFEIKTVVDGHETSAYPINNPDLLFRTWYVMSNGNGHNSYKQEIVANQYKELAMEKLKDFPYDYCINVDVNWQNGLENASQDVTIEQYIEENGTSNVKYYIFVSSSALTLDDTEIFHTLNEVAKIPNQDNCSISMWFLPENELSSVKKSFELYSYPIGQLFVDVLDNYKRIWQGTEDGTLKKELNDIRERMQEVRDNELYR